jgi:DNA polymerase III gamma/tau subunit
MERLSTVISNKILKFLEEPEENIYAILLTENYEKILPTIVSRCQTINLSLSDNELNNEKIELMKRFLKELCERKERVIASENEYFGNVLSDRIEYYENFEILEKIISESINYKYTSSINNYSCDCLFIYQPKTLINILNITNKLKCLIKNNINLNLLLDRYIIEITKELDLCKE